MAPRKTSTEVRPKDLKIVELKMRGLGNTKIAAKTNLTTQSVRIILDKPSVRQMMREAFEEHGFTLSMLAKKNVDMLSTRKEIRLGGKLVEVDDNVAQATALKELNSIYGVYAPKQLDIRASAAETSLEDLTDQADAALEEFGMATGQPASLTGSSISK